MKSERLPYSRLAETLESIDATFSVGRTKHEVHVPAGTRCCYLEGPGGRWVVDDLSFIEDKRSIVYSDADTYGIPLPADAVLVNIRAA